MQEIANDWAAEEGPFKIGMNRARCRCFDGLLQIAQSDGTTLDQLACGCALARHVGQGSAKREPVRLRLGVRGLKRHRARSFYWLFTQFPSRPLHFSFCLSCMTCWSQLSSRPQRLSPIFFP